MIGRFIAPEKLVRNRFDNEGDVPDWDEEAS